MRNIFPTSICNAIHIAQIKTLPSILDSAHCILILKPCCLWTDILRKAKGSSDLEHQPWPECARPPSSHRRPRNFACPSCQDVQRPTQVWAEVIAGLWVNLGDSGKKCSLAADWEERLFPGYLVVSLSVSLMLPYCCGFDSGICICIYIKAHFCSALAECGRRGKPFSVVKSEEGKW